MTKDAHQPMETIHIDDLDWETIRWPGQMGKMLLHLKQMTGRLIRSENDRGITVIVDARTDRRYFRRLRDAFPPDTSIRVIRRHQLPSVLSEISLGRGEAG